MEFNYIYDENEKSSEDFEAMQGLNDSSSRIFERLIKKLKRPRVRRREYVEIEGTAGKCLGIKLLDELTLFERQGEIYIVEEFRLEERPYIGFIMVFFVVGGASSGEVARIYPVWLRRGPDYDEEESVWEHPYDGYMSEYFPEANKQHCKVGDQWMGEIAESGYFKGRIVAGRYQVE